MSKQITDTSEMALDEVLLKLDETLEREQIRLQGTDFIFARYLIDNPADVSASLARNYLRLVEELLIRRASPSEYLNAMSDGKTNDPQSGLHYMDAQQELSQEWNARYPRSQGGLPPGITNTSGWTTDQLNKKLDEVKRNLDWSNTTGSAAKWWNAFEAENISRLPLILRLAEELQVRKATITEFFLAYVYSNTDNIQANLSYLDYTRLKKEEEKKKKERALQSSKDEEKPTPASVEASPLVSKKSEGADALPVNKVESSTSELSFIRCETCRSLVPAASKRCRICNAVIAKVVDASDVSPAKQFDDIKTLNLPERVFSALVNSGINTISDLSSKSDAELLKVPGIGQVALNKIKLVLEDMR
jgi:hypothetical protein